MESPPTNLLLRKKEFSGCENNSAISRNGESAMVLQGGRLSRAGSGAESAAVDAEGVNSLVSHQATLVRSPDSWNTALHT